jgi:hypothetical protein
MKTMRSLDTITAEISEKIVEICHQQNITECECLSMIHKMIAELEVQYTPTEEAVMMWSKRKLWNLEPLLCR